MMKNPYLFLALLVSATLFGQDNTVQNKIKDNVSSDTPTLVLTPTRFFVSQPVRDIPTIDNREELEGKFVPRDGIETTVGMGAKRLRKLNYLQSAGKSPTAIDPLIDHSYNPINQTPTRAPIESFDGISLQVNPPDPSMAVGPNHVVTMENGQWAVYNKQGVVAPGFPRPLTQPLQAPGSTNNAGDPVVMYDREADRWFISQFQLTGDASSSDEFLIGISQTSDPTGAYYVYQYDLAQGNDYPHYGVWGDSYVTAGNFTGAQKVYTFNRQKMLEGDATAEIVGFSPSSLSGIGFAAPIPVHSEGAGKATGPAKIVYYQDDAFPGITSDHIGLWNIDMNWSSAATIAASTISSKIIIPTAAFDAAISGGFANIAQPGTAQRIDAIVGAVMNMSHWYKFAGHESILLNWVVEVTDGSQISGIRWVELRSTNGGASWSVYQEGTFTDPTGNESVFMGCIGMDIQGNIGLGYTKSGVDTFPSLYYTGRLANSTQPLGTMDVAEDVAQLGTSSVTGVDRYGDYGQGSRDPSDDLTFWVTSEYSGNAAAQGGRRVGVYSYRLISEYEKDVAITAITAPFSGDNLTNAESITITVRNFGQDAITNIPVEYTIDNGVPVSAVIPGPIAPQGTLDYTFTTQTDLSGEGNYTICASALLPDDGVETNDSFCRPVSHFVCMPDATASGCNIDGIKRLILEDIIADDGGNACNSDNSTILGYSDRTYLSTDLDRVAGQNVYTLQAQTNYQPAGGSPFDILSVWIDFNDNGEFETAERLITGESFTVANALTDFVLTIPTDAAIGSHVMRCKAFDPDATGDATDPCGVVTFGEVQDYTVNILDSTLNCPFTTTYTAGNWSNGIPENSKAAIIASNYDADVLGNLTTCDLTVNAGVTLDMGSRTLNVYGNIINNGTINGAEATLEITGVTPQSFGGSPSAVTSFKNIEVDNNAGFIINSELDALQLLTITDGNLASNGFLTFKSSATGTASLDKITNPDATISGEVTAERFIPAKRAFRFLTSAVTTTTSIRENWQENGAIPAAPFEEYGTHITGSTSGTNGFDATASGNPSMFTFDETTQTFNAIPNTDAAVLQAGDPYLILIRGNRSTDITSNTAAPSDAVLRAKGLLSTGTMTINDVSSVAGEFSFFGNPYQASVDVVDILTNSLNVNRAQYYIWDPNLGARGQYVTLLLPGGANTSGSDGNRYLQVGQGAFVTTLENGTASVLFEETDKTTGIETTTFQTDNSTILNNPHLIGQLYRTEDFQSGRSLQDSFGVIFSNEFSNDLTYEDALKPTNIDENFGISKDDRLLSFERRALPQESDIIQLLSTSYQVEAYTLRLELQQLSETAVFFVDAFTGDVIELNEGENLVTFEVGAEDGSTASDRFSIVFSNPNLSVDTASFEFAVYPNPISVDELTISSTALLGKETNIAVLNVLGQSILNQKVIFTESTAVIKGFKKLSSGLYLVKITSDKGSVIKKIVKS